MSDHVTPVRMAVTKKTVSVGEDVENREPSPTVGGVSAGTATVESRMVAPQKIKKWNYPTSQQFHCRVFI